MKKNKLSQDKIDRLVSSLFFLLRPRAVFHLPNPPDPRERVTKNEIGFQFRPGVTPKTFDQRFAEVEEYKRIYGNANVPTSYTTLGRWVAGIRMKKARLRKEQVERL